jgi:hypothetical protein
MKYLHDEFIASWAVSAVGFLAWAILIAYLATKLLQPVQ